VTPSAVIPILSLEAEIGLVKRGINMDQVSQAHPADRPLLVSAPRARKIIDVGNTKFWELVKTGAIRMIEVGGRRMVVYASLETLAGASADKAA
jgi:hypothetical protein